MLKLDPKKHPKLIKVLNKIGLICKYVSLACFIGLFIMFVIACGWSCSRSQGSAVVASAEGETVAAESGDIDLSQYPSANLFNLIRDKGNLVGSTNVPREFDNNKYYVGLSNGNNYVPNNIGSYQIDNNSLTVSVGVNAVGYSLAFPLIINEKFIISFNGGLSVFVLFYNQDGVYISTKYTVYSGDAVSPPDNTYYSVIGFISSPGAFTTYENIMVNKGSVAYPYQPNLNDIYNQGYDKGYDAGYDAGVDSGAGFQDGYDQGYTEGLAQSRYGFFSGARYSYMAYADESSGSSFEIPAADYPALDFVSGGVDFSSLYNFFESYSGSGRVGSLVRLSFSEPVPLSKFSLAAQVPVFPGVAADDNVFLSSPNSWRISAVTSMGDSLLIRGNFVYSSEFNCWFFDLETDIYNNSSLRVTELYFNRAVDLSYYTGLILFVPDSDFASNQLLDVTYNNGYNAGFDVGFDNGYQEGFDIAANGGSFGWLISSVQAILNVNFFGNFGIGTLIYVGLGCALVVMTLKFFAGG